jgi:hypothetical protein
LVSYLLGLVKKSLQSLVQYWAMRAVALAAGGCSFSVPNHPDSQIQCTSVLDCPVGWRCATSVSRCIVISNDATPPQLSVGRIEPTEGSAAQKFDVFVSSSEPLIARPTVTAVFGATVGPFAVTEHDGGWLASFVAGDDILRSGPARLLVTADDLGANRASILSATPDFFIDRSAPELISANIQLSAPSSLVAVSKLGPRSTATVVLRFSETLGNQPLLQAQPSVVRIASLETDGGVARFVVESTTDAGEQLVELQATVTDRFGNQQTVKVAELAVDTVSPQQARSSLLERAPFGSDVDSEPNTRLSGATTSGMSVLAVDEFGAELARTTAATDGGFVITLPTERAGLRYQLIDEAGNSSLLLKPDSTRVLLIPRAVANAPRPVSTERLGALGPALDRSDGVRFEPARITVDENDFALAVAGVAARRERGDAEPLINCASATDEGRGLSVHFGGGTVAAPNSDFFEVASTSSLVRRVTEDVPTPRRGASLALDRTRNTLVLFGGNADSTVWEFARGVWVPVSFDMQEGPSLRQEAALVSTSQGVLLLGGETVTPSDRILHDAWLWSNGRWARLDAGSLPTGQNSATYDPVDDKAWVVMQTDAGTKTAWYRRGVFNEVSGRSPDGIGPFAFVPGTRTATLLSRPDNGAVRVWTLQLSDGGWTRGDTVGVQVTKNSAGAAWNPQLQRLVWCLGVNRIGSYNPFDGGASIAPLTPPDGQRPPQTAAASYAADSVHGLVVVTGSPLGNNTWQPSQTWRWSGALGWRLVSDNGPRMRNKALLQLEDGGLFAYGGTQGDTGLETVADSEVYQFSNSTWSRVDSGVGPQHRLTRASVIPFESRLRVLQENEWAWSSQGWLRRSAVPANLLYATLLRQRGDSWFALLGGQLPDADKADPYFSIGTILRDGGLTWRSSPDGGLRLAATRDPPQHLNRTGLSISALGNERYLLFGGALNGVARNDVSILSLSDSDGGAWVHPLQLADPENDGDPTSRYEAVLWWDPGRAAHMLYGGTLSTTSNTSTTLDGLWALDYAQQRAGVQVIFPFDVTETVDARLSIRVRAGASGGVRVAVWAGGQWQSIGASRTATLDNIQSLNYELNAPIHVLSAPGRRLALRIEALEANAQTQSEVMVDSVRAVVAW